MTPADMLSKREKQVVALLLEGKSNKLIALALGISDRTVEFHLKNVYAKLGVSTRVELIVRLGIAPGAPSAQNLGGSTVARGGETAENGDRSDPRMDWATLFRVTVSMIRKEFMMKILAKNPSAFLPVGMSLAALATVLIYVVLFGTARQPDEGTAAHVWQLLMAGQLPIVAFFVIKWLPRAPKPALVVLALQGSAALAALAPVYLLKF
jgi:DNA-binding CsgD family transcriptional regulator